MPTALLTAYRKDDKLRYFASALVGLGWAILASAGTKKFLDQYDIPSKDVADLVGPPILGHRVVTLDRKIYAAILARRDNPEDMAELERIGVEPITLVYVSMYPLAEELASSSCTIDSVIEKTDIGGPTLLRAAAKGNCFVVSDPSQFGSVIEFLRAPPESLDAAGFVAGHRFLSELAAAAETKAGEYALLSALFRGSVAKGEFPHKWQA